MDSPLIHDGLQASLFSGYFQHDADVELTFIAMQKNLHFDPLIICMKIDYDRDLKSINQKDLQAFIRRKNIRFDGLITEPQLLKLFI
jgi:predicted Mrr-cat superfamily restriction endonuclease